MTISEDIKYIGVNDHDIELFEGQYRVPQGMAYNSYVILDERIAVLDTVAAEFKEEWLENVARVLQGRKPDYLIVQHMEPDHSANVQAFLNTYQEAVVVASSKAFAMMQQFFGTAYEEQRVVVSEGSTLELGRHTLHFMLAPMVHWPEVIMTYDALDKVLFSADAFGKFGALDVEEAWAEEARRYYIGIVGKYGVQVQVLLKKAAALDIQRICPLHGPVLQENLDYYLDLYHKWSSYEAECEGTVLAYTSIYGNTETAVQVLADRLREKGCQNVVLYDLARCDQSQAVADAFRYDTLILATPTYNADVFPPMKTFIHALLERNYQSRRVGMIENGSWAPTAAKVMRDMLANSKNISFADTKVKIWSALNEESLAQIEALAEELAGWKSI